MLRKTAQQIDGHADFSAGLDRHGELSKEQAQRLAACLESLGEGPSAFKTITGQITAFAQTLSGYVVGDEPVKALLATSTFAQMEISSYRILVAAASTAGLPEVASVCETILEEELRFAGWLEEQTPGVTGEFLTIQKADA